MDAAGPRLAQECGVVNANKPLDWPSSRVVAHFLRLLGGRSRRDIRVGHAGTLDPAATGVLVLLVGRATRLAELLMDAGKEYVAAVRLGAVSSTDDTEGRIVQTAGDRAVPDEAAVREVLARFIGAVQQVPPAHSAVRVEGRRAYKLARRGAPVPLPPRPVVIHEIELLEYAWPTLRIRVACGRGTYIRSLARDAGGALGVGGYLAALERTRVGPFHIDSAVRPDQCRPDNRAQWLLPPAAAVTGLTRIELTEQQAGGLGRLDLGPLGVPPPGCPVRDGPAALFDPAGRCVALAELAAGRLVRTHVLIRGR